MSAASAGLHDRAALLQELGITLEIQRRFDRAAELLRAARDELEQLLQEVEPDSDAHLRASDAFNEIEGTLYYCDWRAPEGDQEQPD
jgi:hypothetical protein